MTRHRSPARGPARLVIALSALLAGCSGSGGGASPVDAPKAREALKAALDGWKKGDKPASFATAEPAMTVQDMDWQAGAKLLDYQFVDEGKDYGANLNIPVTLKLRTPKGQELKKNVAYIVGTSPTITVFRGLR